MVYNYESSGENRKWIQATAKSRGRFPSRSGSCKMEASMKSWVHQKACCLLRKSCTCSPKNSWMLGLVTRTSPWFLRLQVPKQSQGILNSVRRPLLFLVDSRLAFSKKNHGSANHLFRVPHNDRWRPLQCGSWWKNLSGASWWQRLSDNGHTAKKTTLHQPETIHHDEMSIDIPSGYD